MLFLTETEYAGNMYTVSYNQERCPIWLITDDNGNDLKPGNGRSIVRRKVKRSSEFEAFKLKQLKKETMINDQFFDDQLAQLDCAAKCAAPHKPDPYNNLNDFIKMFNPGMAVASMPYHQNDFYSYLSGTTVASTPCCPTATEEKETTMARVYNDAELTSAAKNHLFTRADCAFRKIDGSLQADFGLTNEESPKTPKEMTDRIIAGKFALPKDADNEDDYIFCGTSDLARKIIWRDPAKVADKDGYKAAKVLLDAAYNSTVDAIMVSEPAEGLVAYQNFTKQTFH